MNRPDTEAELAQLVAGADAPLRIMGGGTRSSRSGSNSVLSVAGLDGITLYEPGAMTIVAKAGTPVTTIEAALAAENQMLAFEPMDHRTLLGTQGQPTIGGVVAGNVSGPRRISAVGACRDSLLGVRFVDGAGTILKNGGRVMKNVTGYDLTKLMCGAYGTLGVLTEVSLKVLPRAETEATVMLPVSDAAVAVKAMATALASPFEVSGAAFDPSAEGAAVLLRVEGMAASVSYRSAELRTRLGAFGASRVEEDPARSQQIWQDIRDVRNFASHDVVIRLSIKPSDLPQFCAHAANTFVDAGPDTPAFDYMADWGGGLVWCAATAEQLDICAKADPSQDASVTLVNWAQSYCAQNGGHATLTKGPDALWQSVPAFQPQPLALATLEDGLRRKFDPKGLFNPGLMGATQQMVTA